MEKGLPKNWEISSVENVAQILDNLRKPVNAKERALRQGDVPYYGATGQAGWIDDYIFEEEIVLLGEDGAPFFDRTKNVAYLVEGKSWVNNHAHVLKAHEKITINSFILHYLNQFNYKGFVGGTTRLKLNQRNLKLIPFPLPPLPEQKRIVAKLDKLFGHLEALKERLEKVPNLLEQFRQSVLTQAVTGKLTEEWREGKELEPVENIFQSIIERRKNHPKKKVRELKINLRSDIDLFELPAGWKWSDLQFLMDENDNFCYGVVQPGDRVENQQKLIRVLDLSNGIILLDQLRGIDWNIDKNYKRSKVKKGDLLVSIVGTIGRTAIVGKDSEGFNIARAIAKIPIKDFEVEYIKMFIDSNFGQKWLIEDAREVARKTLNLNQLSTIPFPISSIAEQKEIARSVASLFAKADAIESRYKKLKSKIEDLPQAFLAKAFRGELVEQLPGDGDARELLEEIKKMQEIAKISKKRK